MQVRAHPIVCNRFCHERGPQYLKESEARLLYRAYDWADAMKDIMLDQGRSIDWCEPQQPPHRHRHHNINKNTNLNMNTNTNTNTKTNLNMNTNTNIWT